MRQREMVVVGNGMVGHRFCERLAERGGTDRFAVTVLGDETRAAYDRVHLSEFFAGRGAEELMLTSRDRYAEHDMDLRLGRAVAAIDRERRRVVVEGGEAVAYDALVLACGSRPSSSNTYGFRVVGSRRYRESAWTVGYAGSYANQFDAADNPVDYNAHYVAAEGGLTRDGLGRLAVGYELLGSDDGKARFVTPLATAHKFNGFADAFLDNGGVDGLQDLYVTLSPALPWKLEGSLVYHRFWSDEGDTHLGSEWDAVLQWPVLKHVTLLTKAAWFEGTSRGPVDRWRYWLELTFHY